MPYFSVPPIWRAACGAALVIFSVTSAPTLLVAQDQQTAENMLRIDIAGRQRMLTQRISKAVCFIHGGVDVEAQKVVLDGAVTLFTESLYALRRGSEESGLGLEANPHALQALDGVDRQWAEFYPLVQQIIEADECLVEDVERLDENGLILLAAAQNAVTKITQGYGRESDGVSLVASTTAGLPGRQRMLSQRGAKEFCLVDAGVDVAENRARLEETTLLFTNTLNALIDGIPGMMPPPPNEEIRNKLLEVRAAWERPEIALIRAYSGETITDEDRQAVAVQMEDVLFLMNVAVGMY